MGDNSAMTDHSGETPDSNSGGEAGSQSPYASDRRFSAQPGQFSGGQYQAGGYSSDSPYGGGFPDHSQTQPFGGYQTPEGYPGYGHPGHGYPDTQNPTTYPGPAYPGQGYTGAGYPGAGYPGPGYQHAGYPGPMYYDPDFEIARNAATTALILAIVGLFTLPFILGPLALWQAGKARQGRADATAGTVLGWITTVWGLLVLIPVTFVLITFLIGFFGAFSRHF